MCSAHQYAVGALVGKRHDRVVLACMTTLPTHLVSGSSITFIESICMCSEQQRAAGGLAWLRPAALCWRACSVPAFLAPLSEVLGLRIQRVFAGVPSSSVQWGAWSGVGMVASSRAVLARMQRAGIGSITPAAGLTVLSTLLAARTPLAPQVCSHLALGSACYS